MRIAADRHARTISLKHKATSPADKAASGGILASYELAMAIGCGFLQAFGGASGSATTKVLLEAPHQVDPHSTVDPDPFQDGVQIAWDVGFLYATALASGPVEQF